ncbi:MAG: MOSC domain-containing protein [Pseudotabrizicola sp.]|uniref:MOSC domain-containing protein n=1 Tax=Pseudotabrizicola sp. TaxID=2939647 RepID=UPI00272FCEC9|nr:MOSC domain-containing protein [Pseudotabrizicola sp.]MDP2081746.1 MOSC domain-containing protein [Pseudotabrizicola sp.]MDZ7573041.1 MOSC domain-containing protein [Pseudotabrizicola sp.]
MIRLAQICRHPIKSIGFEELASAPLTQGRALPFDREWAVLHNAAKVTDLTEWVPKMNFLRGVAGPELMAIRARLDEGARRVALTHPVAGDITITPDTDSAALVSWLRPLWPVDRPAPARVTHVPGQAMTDVPEPFLAVLNTASNADLGQRMGRDLSIHRWRGNLWLDGLAPWAEWDLLGRTLRIGRAELRIEQRITRCKATTVNPDTGSVDADTLVALQSGFGHQDFGTYAVVTKSGPIVRGDQVEVL